MSKDKSNVEKVDAESRQFEFWLGRSLEETRFTNGALFVLASAIIAYLIQITNQDSPIVREAAIWFFVSAILAVASLAVGGLVAFQRLFHAETRQLQHLRYIQAIKTHEGIERMQRDMGNWNRSSDEKMDVPIRKLHDDYMEFHAEHIRALGLAPSLQKKVVTRLYLQAALWMAALIAVLGPSVWMLTQF